MTFSEETLLSTQILCGINEVWVEKTIYLQSSGPN